MTKSEEKLLEEFYNDTFLDTTTVPFRDVDQDDKKRLSGTTLFTEFRLKKVVAGFSITAKDWIAGVKKINEQLEQFHNIANKR